MSSRRIIEITDREKTDQQLRQLSRAVEQSPSTVVITSRTGEIEYVNPKFAELTGYVLDEVRGKNPRLLKSGETPREDYRRMWETITQGVVWRGEFHNKKKNGELYCVSASISPIIDTAGHITHFVAVGEDITRRKEAEAALVQAGRVLQTIFDNIQDGVVVVDAETRRFAFANKAFCRMLGYPSDEIPNLGVDDIHPRAELPRIAKDLQAALQGGATDANDVEVLRKDGSVFHADINGARFEMNGRVCILGSFRDITERKATQQSLVDTLAFNANLLSAAPVGILTFRSTGECVSCNEAAAAIVGGTVEELKNQNFRTLESWKKSGLLDLAERVISTRQRQSSDIRVTSTFGKEAWLAARMSLFRSGDDDLLLVITVDITQRRRAEDALRESEERLRQIAETIDDAFWAADVDLQRMFYISPAYERIWGRSLASLYGNPRSFIDAVHPDDRARVLADLRVQKEGQPFAHEYRILRPDGTLRWIANSGLPVPESTGAVRRYVGIARDITERKEADVARERLVAILDATPDFVAIADLEGRVLYLNSSGRTILGLEAGQDLSGTPLGAGHSDWALKQVLEIGIPTAVRDGSWQGMSSLLDREGREVPYSQVILAHKGPDGQVAFISTIMRDLGMLKSLEAQLQQSQRLEAVGRLAGGVAHDFNNLLTVINGLADLALMKLQKGDPLHGKLKEIGRAGDRAATLTRQLLAFSRKQILQPVVVNLNPVVADVEKMLRRLIGEDIELIVTAAADLANVRADLGQMEQVIVNLAVNARDAMPNGGTLTIETRNIEIEETHAARLPSVLPGRYVMLAVSDNGVGMDEATRERIFEPFFTTKGTGKGTGLGLATVYGIVKQSGGSIWVYSEVGKGCTFKIYLPRVEEAAQQDRPALTLTAPRGTETILIVEDEGAIRDVADEILVSAGYAVLAAANGGEALLLLERHDGPVHLMITDVVMPGMSGPQLVERLGKIHPRMKVLFTSGFTDDAIVHHGVLDKGTHFIGKPYGVAELTRKVRQVLDSQDGRPTTA